jgi:hypothetical protein
MVLRGPAGRGGLDGDLKALTRPPASKLLSHRLISHINRDSKALSKIIVVIGM